MIAHIASRARDYVRRVARELAVEVFGIASYAPLVGGPLLMMLGFGRGYVASRGRIEWVLVVLGACVLLSTFPARMGARMLRARWAPPAPAPDPRAAIRERAFAHTQTRQHLGGDA